MLKDNFSLPPELSRFVLEDLNLNNIISCWSRWRDAIYDWSWSQMLNYEQRGLHLRLLSEKNSTIWWILGLRWTKTKILQIKSKIKVMLTVFFGYHSVIYEEFLPPAQTENDQNYGEIPLWLMIIHHCILPPWYVGIS